MKKRLFLFAPVFLSIVILICTLTPSVAMSESISEKVFRLHIIANSDDEADQKLKLKVRDSVLDCSQSIFKSCKTVDEAKNASKSNIPLFTEIARDTIKQNGYTYDVKVEVAKAFFDTRVYDGFTLPAGEYDSLRIIIGEGRGHNWWCVMYPSVCLSGCVDDFDAVLTKDEKNMITKNKYIIKFKTVEIYERIKNQINS
ncbi:MAG: stage II sporulation protein R [Eubacterium sp.]